MKLISAKNSLLVVCLIANVAVRVFAADSEYCPLATTCDNCEIPTWIPEIHQEQVLEEPDICTVTLSWNWPYNTSESDPNPRMVFLCKYDNSEPCNTGDEIACASCGKLTLREINPNENPSVTFTDSCGHEDVFPVADNCLPPTTAPPATTKPPTEPPTTTAEPVVTTTAESVVTTTAEPAVTTTAEAVVTTTAETVVTTTAEPVVTTTAQPATTTAQPATTTVSVTDATGNPEYNCPANSQCPGCQGGWALPDFQEVSYPNEDNTCEVTIFWDTTNAGSNGGPLLSFACIYAETSQYCKADADIYCAACGNITLHGIDPTLYPYIAYSDNCGNATQFLIATECYQPPDTSTPNPDVLCPNPLLCSGCPIPWPKPVFKITGGPLKNDTCDLNISWTATPSDVRPNPRMKFECIYGLTGEYCDDNSHSACASCGQVIFENIEYQSEPYINYTDSCGGFIRINIRSDICQTSRTIQLH